MYGMKPGKRLLTWIMVFVMTLSMLPLNVLASYPVEPAKIIQPDVGTYLTYQFYVGETKVDEQIVKEGETLLAPKTPEAAEGQRFTGWYRGTEKFEGFGTPQEPIAASETIRLDAKFDDVFYVFFVDTNARIVATREGKSGDTITFDGVSFPVKSDESITGWYLEKDLTTKVKSVTLVDKDVKLYAKVEKGHWITFDSTGGSYVAPQFVTMGGSTAQPTPNPTKAGFTFDGWQLNGAAFTFGDALDADIKLTAKWTAKETVSYTVIHWLENADDTEYSYKESETKSGAAGNLTTATTKKYDGFTAQTIEQQTIAGDGSTIVNVRYKRNVYEVKFYTFGSLFTNPKEYTYLKITAKHGANISKQWPTYNGSSTWGTKEGGGPYQVNIETMPLGGAKFYGPLTGSGSETAYYYVEVLPGESGGTLVDGKYYKQHHEDTSPGTGYKVTKEDQYDITGYTFNEKISTKIGKKYDGAKFYYTRNGYDVVYVNNGKTVHTQSYPFEASIADAGSYTPSRPEGIDAAYVFTGWYADPAGAQPYDFAGKTMPAQNVTVYAHWAAPVHKVTFKVDGQSDQTMTDVAHNATITLPAAPTPPEGEDFLGWVDENGKPFKEDTQITRDLVLTAKFGSKTGYTVTYDTTDGNGTVSDVNHYGKGAAATVLNGADTAPANKVFLYWKDDTGNKYYPNNTITINGNVKLTAVYGETSQPVAITYHSNFGTDSTVPSNNIPNNGLITVKTYDETNLPAQVGYTFTGWNTQADGKGLAFAEGGQARVDSTAPNDLYAQWTVNQYSYTVQYYYDGALDSAETETPKADYGSVINNYPDKNREGYELSTTEGLPLTVGINAADNVIKVYYVKTTVPYTIHHYLYNTTVPVANDMTGRVKVGETQSATVATTFLPGYEAAVEYYVPEAVTVTAAMTEVTLTVYYKMRLTIKAGDAAKPYDGSPLTCPTFTVTGLVNGDQAAGITLSMTADSTITDAGTQANTIDETTVTGIKGYYKVLCQPGTLTITPNTDEITVIITGNNDTKQYTGSEQSVTGFTADVGDKPITVALKEGKEATAKGTNVGEYKMGLTADDFTVTSANYSNIKVEVVDGFLEITPNTDEITVTITGNNDTKQYTGSEQSVTGFTADVGDKPITVALKEGKEAIAKGTNVGKYKMGLTKDDFTVTSANYSNIKVEVVDGFLEITPNTDEITVTITGNNDTKQYTGSEQSVTGFTTDVGSKPITVALKEGKTAIAKGTNVGEYKMGLTKDDFTVTSKNYSNIKVEVIDGFLEITPDTDEITVTITGENDTKQYNGSEQSVTGFTTDVGNKPITVTLKDGKTAIAKGTNVGEYKMGLTKDDFTVTSKNYSNIKVEVIDGFLEITPNTDEITVTITGNNDTRPYTGSEQSVTGFTTDVGDKPITVTLNTAGKDTAKGTDVGEYKMNLTADDFTVTSANYSNITVKVVDGLLKITPNDSEITVTITGNNATKQYTGSEQSVTGFTTDVGDKPITVTLNTAGKDTAKGTDVGEYKMNLTADDFTVTSANYSNIKVKVVDGFLEITPDTDEITVTITGNNATKQYTGSEQSVTGFTTDVGNKPITVALKEGKAATAKGTDVGEYKMGLTADDFTVTSANYSNIKVVVVDGFLEITPNTDEITVTITGNNDTKQYTGSEQSVTGFTTDVGSKPITVALKEGKEATAKGTNVGEYKMGLTADDFTVTSANYSNIKVVVVDGFLEITPNTDEITVTITGNNDTKQYTGSEQSVTGFTTDVGSKPITVALKEGKEATAKGTDVGEYKMGLTKDDFTVTSANYSNIKVEVVDGFLEITPDDSEITVTITGNNDTKQYTGSEQSVTGFTADVGSKPITVTLNTAGKDTAKGTNVGEYTMGLTADDFTVTSTNYSNIKVEVVDGFLTITPNDSVEINVKIVGKNDSRTYTGLMQKVEGFTYTVDVKGTDVTVALKDGKKAVAEGLSAGTYHMGLTKEFFDVTSKNYSNIKVEVVDGFLVINYTPYVPPTVKIEDDDALGLNTTDHFAYIIGYPDGTVQPNGQITRAEVATIFFRLLTEDVRTANLSRSNRYFDVAASEWYNTAVSTLSSMGIITGYPDGTFRPNAYITRAEFAAIAARFDPSGDKTTASFRDILNHWAKDEISIAYNNSWVDGYPDGTFGPQRNITRAETMTLVNRVLNRRPETEEDLLPEMTIWTDNANPNAWYYLAVQEATNSHYYKFKTNSKYEKWTELRENRDWTQLEK